jgi:hypothetical protein
LILQEFLLSNCKLWATKSKAAIPT